MNTRADCKFPAGEEKLVPDMSVLADILIELQPTSGRSPGSGVIFAFSHVQTGFGSRIEP